MSKPNESNPSIVVIGRREKPETYVRGHFRGGKFVSSHKRINGSSAKVIASIDRRRELLHKTLGITEYD